METIKSGPELKVAIARLEIVQANEGKLMKEKFHTAYESIKPMNLIKSTFAEVASSKEIKTQLTNTSIALASGYVAEKLFEGITSGPVKRLIGAAVMFGVTNIVAKNPETVKMIASGLFKITMDMARSKPYTAK